MKNIQKLTIAALLLALGQVLPLISAQIPTIGALFSPMHLPVLLTGFVLGPLYGLIIGVLTPILRHIIFAMPPFPGFIFMAIELGTYGLVSGLLFVKAFKRNYKLTSVYISLICAMLLGRVMYGLVKLVFMKLVMGKVYTITLWLADTITGSLPGIVLQLLFIPYLVIVLRKRNII